MRCSSPSCDARHGTAHCRLRAGSANAAVARECERAWTNRDEEITVRPRPLGVAAHRRWRVHHAFDEELEGATDKSCNTAMRGVSTWRARRQGAGADFLFAQVRCRPDAEPRTGLRLTRICDPDTSILELVDSAAEAGDSSRQRHSDSSWREQRRSRRQRRGATTVSPAVTAACTVADGSVIAFLCCFLPP